MGFVIRPFPEREEGFLGLAVVRETDRVEAMRFYKTKAKKLRAYDFEEGEAVLGLFPVERSLYTVILADLGRGNMEYAVVGRTMEGVESVMKDFAEYAELIIVDVPEPYLEEEMQLYTGERFGRFLHTASKGKCLLVRRLI